MENFRSRLASRKQNHDHHQHQQHQQQQEPNLHKDLEDVERQKEEESEEHGTEKSGSFYKKMMPNITMLKPTKFFWGIEKPSENIALKINRPSIGNLDEYHTRNIYANRYKETTKR